MNLTEKKKADNVRKKKLYGMNFQTKKSITYRLMHALFHIRTVIIGIDIGQRALARGSISVEG